MDFRHFSCCSNVELLSVSVQARVQSLDEGRCVVDHLTISVVVKGAKLFQRKVTAKFVDCHTTHNTSCNDFICISS